MKDGQIYYVGPRASDIVGSPLYSGSITAAGSDKNGNYSYCMSSGHFVPYDSNNHERNFYTQTIKNIVNVSPGATFVSYAQNYISNMFSSNFHKYFICKNDENTNSLLDSKIFSRYWIKRYTPILNYVTTPIGDLRYSDMTLTFPKASSFMVQEDIGRGCSTTFIIESEDDLCSVQERRGSNNRAMVSPFFECERVLHINQNALVIGAGVLCLQPSIQKIKQIDTSLEYCGANYSKFFRKYAYLRAEIDSYTRKIGLALARIGYRGIYGIDYLFDKYEKKMFFIEINPRFQNSSGILNKALLEQGHADLHQLNYAAFHPGYMSNLKDIDDIPRVKVDAVSTLRKVRPADKKKDLVYREMYDDGLDVEYRDYSEDATLLIEVTSI